MNKKQEDKNIKLKLNETIKDMTLEELMMAMAEQDTGLINNLRGIIASQVDVIKTQQEELSKSRELISSLTTTVERLNAQVQMVVQKQKDLEEFALIATGISKVNQTTVGKKQIEKEAEKYVEEQEKEK